MSNKMQKKQSKNETKWFSPDEWEFRMNSKRKQKGRNQHPALVVGEKDNTYANFGLTHSPKRGHHKNIKLSKNPNPQDKKDSFVRDDLSFDNKNQLKVVLRTYTRLSDEDIDKVCELIKKRR